MINKGDTLVITGVAGFIGAALAKKFLNNGYDVIGIDNLNNYYDLSLKEARLSSVLDLARTNKVNFNFYKCSIEDKESLEKIFSKEKPRIFVNLAAQAGVRYSLENPDAYFQSNLLGFYNILELIKKYQVENFIFASSSSVYGGRKDLPFNEEDKVDKPISFYAATKKSNEILAYSYSHLYKIPMTGLRFFTVYGPWGRPDMAPMIFLKSMLSKKPIKIFNNGKMKRDFTFIDDIVEGVYRCCFKKENLKNTCKDNYESAPYKIFNIGNGNPIELMEFINVLEEKLNIKSEKIFLPMQKGDVYETFADTKALERWVNYKAQVKIDLGLDKLVKWYKNYY